MNLSGVIKRRSNITLAVTRRGVPVLGDNGEYTDGASSSILVRGLIYPARGREIQLLPEGRRNDLTMGFLSDVELLTAEVGGGEGDLMSYQGDTFEALKVDPWGEEGFWLTLWVKRNQ